MKSQRREIITIRWPCTIKELDPSNSSTLETETDQHSHFRSSLAPESIQIMLPHDGGAASSVSGWDGGTIRITWRDTERAANQ